MKSCYARVLGRGFFDILAQAHKPISEFEDQDDFDNVFYKLHRERNQTLLQFATVARAACLKQTPTVTLCLTGRRA